MRGRDGRQRFGFAVDALGLDTSKSKEDARLARTVYEGLAAETHQALDVYKAALKEQMFWEGRSAQAEPYAQLSTAYRSSADAVDAWREARQREKEAKARLAERDRVATDLDFQINALRTALANHEQGIDKDREAASKRSIELSSRAEGIESKLLQLATRFAASPCAPRGPTWGRSFPSSSRRPRSRATEGARGGASVRPRTVIRAPRGAGKLRPDMRPLLARVASSRSPPAEGAAAPPRGVPPCKELPVAAGGVDHVRPDGTRAG